MKTKVLLLCMCVCIFTQCNRAGDEVYIPETEQKETEIPADEPLQTPETPSLEESYEQELSCPSPAKTGEMDDIVGKWKLILEINKSDTSDRSCEDIVYHFREDGTLTVSNNSTEVCEFEYSGYPFCPACYPPKNPQRNLKMGDATIFCEVSLRKMSMYPQIRFTERGYVFPNHEIRIVFLRIE
jgi:hypothetical protein